MRRVIAVVAVLLLGLVSCGTGAGQDPLAAVAGAPQRFEEVKTSRFAMTMELSGEGVPQGPLVIETTGEGDFTEGRLRMTMDMGALGPEGDSQVEMILDDTMMYMRMPFLEGVLPAGVSWVSADLEELGREAGIDLSELMQLGRNDPTTMLETLRGASEGVDVVEEGVDVRGASTTHYRATIQTEKAFDQVPEETREQLRELLEGSGVPESYPVDVWIDEEGLPRRMRTTFETSPEGMGSISQAMTMEFFDFGVEVDVTPPPAEETVDISELGGFGG